MRPVCARTRLCVLFVVSLTISLMAQITPASAMLIDFETYPWGEPTSHFDPIDTQFSSWGISLISSEDDYGDLADAVIRQDTLPWLNYPSGISALAPWPGEGINYGPAQAPINIYFDSPISYFSIYAMDVGWNGLLAEAYDENSMLMSSISIDGIDRDHSGPPGGDGLDFIEFALSGISYITFSQIHDLHWDIENDLGTEGYLLDDMTFYPVPVAVPEPSTILLLTSGLIGLWGYVRKSAK